MFSVTETKQVLPFPPRPGGIPPATTTLAESDELAEAILQACSHPQLANSVALGRLCDRLEDLFAAVVALENKTRAAIASPQPDLVARGVSALRAQVDPPATDDADDKDDPDATPLSDPDMDSDEPISVFLEAK